MYLEGSSNCWSAAIKGSYQFIDSYHYTFYTPYGGTVSNFPISSFRHSKKLKVHKHLKCDSDLLITIKFQRIWRKFTDKTNSGTNKLDITELSAGYKKELLCFLVALFLWEYKPGVQSPRRTASWRYIVLASGMERVVG